MEKLSIPESEEKEPSEQEVIQAFQERGKEDPEAKALLLRLIEKKEEESRQSADFTKASIELNLWRARLYFVIGLKEEALENFEDARVYASNVGKDKLCQAIERRMTQLGL